MANTYRNIKAWEAGDKLAFAVYRITKTFPSGERFGLTSQLRRAALSIPTNIAEGYARQNDKVFKTFLDTAYGSLVETEYLLDFAYRAGMLSEEKYKETASLATECGRILWRFSESIKRSSASR